MAFRLGLVGLCTSHPGSWLPIIRRLDEEMQLDLEVTACWDSGETRPPGFAAEFAEQQGIPHPVSTLEAMLPLVDGVIVHTTNWDRHVQQAEPFVRADKAVFLDKPIAGNPADAAQILDWAAMGKRVFGGSSLRFACEVQEFREKHRGGASPVHTAFGGCGVDEFNYGIHAYSLMCGIMGPGIESVRYLGMSGQKHIQCTWKNGAVCFLAVGGHGQRLPFHMAALTATGLEHIRVDTGRIYRALLEAVLPYLTGRADEPPCPVSELLEAELAAIAARRSWMLGGATVFLTDLRQDDEGYDGTAFAREYRRSRLGTK